MTFGSYKGIVTRLNLATPAEIGKSYEFEIPGQPVPKSTQRPPKGKNAYFIVQSKDKYKPLRRTWEYQELVACHALQAKLPVFHPGDPIYMRSHIFLKGIQGGDRKNYIAALEDGLQYGGWIPNDKKVTGGTEWMNYCYGDEARVWIRLKIDPRIQEYDSAMRFFGNKQKKVIECWERLGITTPIP